MHPVTTCGEGREDGPDRSTIRDPKRLTRVHSTTVGQPGHLETILFQDLVFREPENYTPAKRERSIVYKIVLYYNFKVDS